MEYTHFGIRYARYLLSRAIVSARAGIMALLLAPLFCLRLFHIMICFISLMYSYKARCASAPFSPIIRTMALPTITPSAMAE